MIKNVLSSLFAVFLFALGTAGSWYFVQWQEEKATVDEVGELDSANRLPLKGPDSETNLAESELADVPVQAMAVPVRTGAMSAEQIVRAAGQYRHAIEQLKRREAAIEGQESQLRLAQQDLDQRKMEIEGILKQVESKLEQGQELMKQIVEEKSRLGSLKEEVLKEKESLQEAKSVPPEVEKANLSKMAMLLGGMNEVDAAEVIKAFANKGDMNFALRILDNIEDRDASKILDSLGNSDLVAEIMEAYRELKRDESSLRKR